MIPATTTLNLLSEVLLVGGARPMTLCQRMTTRDKAIRISDREGLCSVSSNTKWQRVIAALVKFPCEKRVKWIDSPDPTRWQIGLWQPAPTYIEGALGPKQLKFVEWIEVRRYEEQNRGALVSPLVTDYSVDIRTYLEETRAVFEESEDVLRVFGYTRPSGTN